MWEEHHRLRDLAKTCTTDFIYGNGKRDIDHHTQENRTKVDHERIAQRPQRDLHVAEKNSKF